MKYAVLADIHGNATAFEAVLKDCKREKIDNFILLGDLFSKGSNPTGVWNQIIKLNICVSIRGNTDNWLFLNDITKRESKMVEYMKAHIMKEQMNCFDQMKEYYIMDKEYVRIIFIHDANDLMNRSLSMKDSTKCLCVVSGHTHIPQISKEDDIVYYNPGSVGLPYDHDARASYGILTIDDQIQFQIRKVIYDVEREIQVAKERRVPFINDYIGNLQSGIRMCHEID